ncbi:MAG: phytanoyl-CoA dioxygenase family protein [Candidatus Tumulicola sp.]
MAILQNKAEVTTIPELINQELPSYDPHDVNPPVRPGFRSQFGGLWTDLNNADAVLAGKVAIGAVSPSEARLVNDFIQKGFVLLPRATDPNMIDRVLEDVESIVDGKIPRKCSYWDSTGHHIEAANRANTLEKEAKILDMHEASQSAQQIIFSPAISRFLNIIFERPALAFQSLGFLRGSQQGVHRDTAFVRVSSSQEFVASWIALEDIVPGSGELEYYVGSHALPDYLFSGGDRWVKPGNPEVDGFSEGLHAMARAAKLDFTQFRPKKGDVLIWAAELMHGGSHIENEKQTRKSLVTHYCPVDQHPMYFYKGNQVKRPSVGGNYICAERWS